MNIIYSKLISFTALTEILSSFNPLWLRSVVGSAQEDHFTTLQTIEINSTRLTTTPTKTVVILHC